MHHHHHLPQRDPLAERQTVAAVAQERAQRRHSFALRQAHQQRMDRTASERTQRERLESVRDIERERASLVASLPKPVKEDYAPMPDHSSGNTFAR